MHLKFVFILLLALVAESAFARLQGHHRRHVHGKHLTIKNDNDNDNIGSGSIIEPRTLIDVNGNAIGIGPLTATLDILPGATLAPTNDHPHDDHPHDGPSPHGGHHGGHSHGHHPHGGHPHGHDNEPSPHPIKATAAWDQTPPDGQFIWDGFSCHGLGT
ncbi:hypothetical protein SI65_07424 [Aspergillus cristatus]|uniref:Uncharacterized protein n=1 Tax=Aspergillus cristatus TaxID=573508 RepID=A0A1E3B7S1_ASPCR|nr:hypothetical protein SI65_07424 [Aspergillus cristatus]